MCFRLTVEIWTLVGLVGLVELLDIVNGFPRLLASDKDCEGESGCFSWDNLRIKDEATFSLLFVVAVDARSTKLLILVLSVHVCSLPR